jgi:hypothetical protein
MSFAFGNQAFAQSSELPPVQQTQSLPGLDVMLKNRPDQGPVIVPPISFVDINTGHFGALEINLTDAQFLDTSVDKLHLLANNMDLNKGVLQSLKIDIAGGHFADFVFDQLSLATQGNLNFDPGVLLNHRMLQFTEPAQAEVTAVVSQASLNQFLNAPHTLEKLSVTATKQATAIASLFGANANNIGLHLEGADVTLGKSNHLLINAKTSLGMGAVGVPIPLQLDAKLGLTDGWVTVSDTHLESNGQEISPALSQMLVKKINGLASWGHKSDDIQFSFTDLKVVANKQFIVHGTAQIRRLRFSKEQ